MGTDGNINRDIDADNRGAQLRRLGLEDARTAGHVASDEVDGDDSGVRETADGGEIEDATTEGHIYRR